MRTLNEIGADLEALDALLAEVGGDVSEEAAEAAVDQWLAEIGAERDAKLDRYAAYITDLEARAKAKTEEAARLAERARIESERAKFLKLRLLDFLHRQGLNAVDTPLHRFTVCANGGKVPVVLLAHPHEIPEAYRRHEVRISVLRAGVDPEQLHDAAKVEESYRVELDLIRARLEEGEALEFASLGDRGIHLRIR